MTQYKINKISVVIVTHNRTKQLITCINSIIYLKKKADEIMVLDNSKYSTAEKIVKLLQKYAPIKYVKIPNNTRLGYARYVGFKNAKGNIVCFIDDDAYALPDWTKEIALEFTKNSFLPAIRGRIQSSTSSNYWSSFSQAFEESFLQVPLKRQETDFLIGANFALNKTVCLKKGIQFNRSLVGGEDIDLSLQLKQKNLRIVYLPKAIVLHDYRLTLLSYFKRWIEYTLFDFDLKSRFAAPLFYDEYIPRRRRDFIFLPIFIFSVLINKCSNFIKKTSKKWLIGIIIKEMATLTGILIIITKYQRITPLKFKK